MPPAAKKYVYLIIFLGSLTSIAALIQLQIPPISFWLCIAGAVAAGGIKLRLPGMEGTYAPAYLPVLYSMSHFGFSESVVVATVAALAQSYIAARKRPTPIQALFNVANLVLSVLLSTVGSQALDRLGLAVTVPSVAAVLLGAYFVVNTTIVSGILALLQSKPLGEVCRNWYSWSLPYYLIGASVIATLFPATGPVHWEGALISLCLLSLIHFYAMADISGKSEAVVRSTKMNTAARILAASVCGGALTVVLYAFSGPHPDLVRFTAYCLTAFMLSTWKLRLPQVHGTLSPGFVVLLAAIADGDVIDVTAIAVIAAITQSLWRSSKRPTWIQVAFNASSLVLSSSAAYAGVRAAVEIGYTDSIAVRIAAAATMLWVINTGLVMLMISFVQRRSVVQLWSRCQFWTYACYMVGAAVAALMVISARVAGTPTALIAIPLMYCIWLSYRQHASREDPA